MSIRNESVGDIVKLVYTTDPYSILKCGDEGVVRYIDDAGTVFVNWDNGSRLGLIPGEDLWAIIRLNKETTNG